MAHVGIKDAFAKYGANLRNVQWSVSAWASDGSLVVSLWHHHWRKAPPGYMEFADSVDRWSGHGNAEFRENLAQAFAAKSKVRLVIVRTEEIAKVEAGADVSKVKKDFQVRDDLIGEITEWDGTHYAVRFHSAR